MRRALAALLLAACAAPLPAPLPLERALGRPEGRLPAAFSFSRDNARVAYLLPRGENGVADLWELEVATGKRSLLLRAEATALSPEERAARERRRERGEGITRFWRNPADDSILFVLDGDLHRLADGRVTRLTGSAAPELAPRWSPDGRAVAFVREQNLHVLRDGVETPLTTAGGGTVECGLAEFIAAEELGRHQGFWWSPDSSRLAYVETDVSKVPLFFLPGLDERGTPVEQRYPRPGDPNAEWSLKVVPAAGGEPVAMDVRGEYLVRAGWLPGGDVYAQVADRLQRTLTLFRCDPATGRATEIGKRTDERWVGIEDVHLLDGRFLWEEDMRKAVGAAPEEILDISAVHADRFVLFLRSLDRARQREVALLDTRTGRVEVLRSGGWHAVAASTDGSRFVHTVSRAGEPPRITVVGLDGEELVEIARGQPVGELPRPEFLAIAAEDGTPLRATLLRAPGRRRGPAILHCYGGPGSQLVADRWGGATYLWHARLAALGYTILTVDNRGCRGYGPDVMRAVHGRLLDLEVRDQTAAARWLAAQDFVDPERIGIWGWSYGGTLALMCLLRAPDVFAAAVSVAPVTDWRDYDTAYTERYLGLPADNAAAYARASPVTSAERLRRPLLLAHGLRDDNVHFRHATAFLDAAQRAGARVEVDFYPRGAHGIGGPRERRLLFARMEAFWGEHLRLP